MLLKTRERVQQIREMQQIIRRDLLRTQRQTLCQTVSKS